MIERKAAAKLVKRLSGLDFYPTVPEAQDVLVDALATAPTLAAATVVVDDWLAANREAPKPADLRAAGKQQEPHEYSAEGLYGQRPAVECRNCRDNGWITDEESGRFKACWCACGKQTGTLALVAGLNAKFSIGGRRESMVRA